MSQAMRQTELRKIFDRFNTAYFAGRLPRFKVAMDFKTNWCDIVEERIHLRPDTKDVDAVILHEMVHKLIRCYRPVMYGRRSLGRRANTRLSQEHGRSAA
jgi:hypothetical protein